MSYSAHTNVSVILMKTSKQVKNYPCFDILWYLT